MSCYTNDNPLCRMGIFKTPIGLAKALFLLLCSFIADISLCKMGTFLHTSVSDFILEAL